MLISLPSILESKVKVTIISNSVSSGKVIGSKAKSASLENISPRRLSEVVPPISMVTAVNSSSSYGLEVLSLQLVERI